MRIVVLGSGGVGGYHGALLARGGHDVVFVARDTHLEAMQQRGLTVRPPEGTFTIPVSAVVDEAKDALAHAARSGGKVLFARRRRELEASTSRPPRTTGGSETWVSSTARSRW